MINDNNSVVKLILSALLFPTFFQEAFIRFAWGAGDSLWLMIGKRLFLLLPVLGIIFGCWLSVACVLSLVIRPNRREFITDFFLTWWDLGKAIASFWGGILKFVFNFFVTLLGAVKVITLGLWSLIQEILFMPLRLVGNLGRSVVSSSVPWIAIVLTLFWCFLEAVIFTYVTTPLVVDTFSNITGDNLSVNMVRIPLFVFLLFVVLGSYAVLSNFVDSFKLKKIPTILGIGAIEIVVLFVEVVFLYREFVDALVPWFAQYSANFELGVFSTLAIATFVWFGVRSISWFLFAASGTPTIMAIIQGKGLAAGEVRETTPVRRSSVSTDFMDRIKENASWIEKAGDDLLAAFALPPLQVLAASINFCTLLVSGEHLFELPLKDMNAVVKTRTNGLTPEAKGVKDNGSKEYAKERIGDFQHV
ncbi:MAG TPA: hypothetical protein VGA99_08790 [bacterium]